MIRAIIVDDHPTSRVMLERVLGIHGFEPFVASSAEEAMKRHIEQPIDIWFIDWMMPGASGLDLAKAIRARAGGDMAHIIMVTAKNSADDLATAFEAGVDDFIAKPIGILELQSRLKAANRLVMLNRSAKQRAVEAERLNEELTKLNRRLEVVASTDGLTGLLNRHAGLVRLHEVWQAQSADTPLSVAVVDIDFFKRVNDQFGHARGDAALRHVACVLAELSHPGEFVSRIGGEEFMVVLPGSDAATAVRRMEAARLRVERARCLADGKDEPLTISIGIAERTSFRQPPEDVIRNADRAMYDAKSKGRNRVSRTPTPMPIEGAMHAAA